MGKKLNISQTEMRAGVKSYYCVSQGGTLALEGVQGASGHICLETWMDKGQVDGGIPPSRTLQMASLASTRRRLTRRSR